jgi:hypothetical protein
MPRMELTVRHGSAMWHLHCYKIFGMIRRVLLITPAFLLAASANAISYNANVDGLTAPGGSLFSASGGALGLKTVAGWTGLGVAGGSAGGEIDLGQSLQVSFLSTTTLQSLTLAFLYDGPEFSDPQEIALTIATGGTTHNYALQITGETSANWNGPGSVLNHSPANATGGGVWEITNPFGTDAISVLSLSSGGRGSDFSLQGFSSSGLNAASVPDGGATAVLLGLGLMGFGLVRRNLRS